MSTAMPNIEAQNARYRRLLDQAGTPAELRHRQRNMLATLRQVIQQSAASGGSLERYVSQLDDRLSAPARIYAAIDQHGAIDLHNIVADELLFYGTSEGRKLTVFGPPILFTPLAGQALALTIHELAVNSVEHGAIGSGEGRLEISWNLGGDRHEEVFELTWFEPTALAGAPGPPGFGTRVITEMLPYQLSAETSLQVVAGKLVCRVRMPFNPDVGSRADS